jgi:2-phosphoglycerate kinase
MEDPIIILLGGAAGTSKTTLSKMLVHELDIAHRLGSGFIREIAKGFVGREENPFLYNYSFKPHIEISPFENLHKQSDVLTPSMELCIKRGFNEGTSLIIEGVNVIPGLISKKYVSLSAVLAVKDFDQHYEMITGKTHFKRSISSEDFKKVRSIQDEFVKRAEINGWDVIYIDESIEATIQKIKDKIH